MQTYNVNFKRIVINFLLLFFLSVVISAQSKNEDLIIGKWLMPNKMGTLKIYKCNNHFCGKIIDMEQKAKNGGPLLDVENPVDSLKTRHVVGLQVMSGYKYAEKNKWIDGNFYIPKKGKEASPDFILIDKNHLNIKIHFLIFSKTIELTRVTQHKSVQKTNDIKEK